ncbi:hypothetical protein ACIRG4_09600 [Streptomyces sp. NPDC102395]|uniref:hypothetical protein n=1 Tax=Streptomyces sp. NPDC102395 TaxID=3366168 RepID=UPI003808F62C
MDGTAVLILLVATAAAVAVYRLRDQAVTGGGPHARDLVGAICAWGTVVAALVALFAFSPPAPMGGDSRVPTQTTSSAP